LRHLYRPVEKHVVLEGVRGGIIKGELGLIHRDKVQINAMVTAAAALIFFIMGAIWSSMFMLVALFFGIVSGMSAYIAMIKLEERKRMTHLVTPHAVKTQ
jgi:predicted membrane protein